MCNYCSSSTFYEEWRKQRMLEEDANKMTDEPLVDMVRALRNLFGSPNLRSNKK